MSRHLLAFITIGLAAIAAAGQTPTPTPYDTDAQGRPAEAVPGVQQVAPDYRSDTRVLPDLGRVGVDQANVRPLTLAETIEMALENNKDISITRRSITSAEFDLRAARGGFQPRLTGQAFYDRVTNPNVSIFSTNSKATQATVVGNAAITGFVPRYGTVITGGVNNSRITTDNPITILSPQYNASLNFGITQPLLRGRKIDAGRRAIEIAKVNLELTDTQFRQRSIEVVTAVEKAYWDLVFALRNLQVQRDSVRDAKDQLEHNRRLVEEGQLAPIDIVAAETQVANFEQAVYDALNAVNIAENVVKNLIAPRRGDRLWGQAILPVESVEKANPDPTLSDAMDLAIKNRPELDLNSAQQDINRIDQRYYREQSRPQVDLTASYTSAGVGGSQNPGFTSPFPLPCTTNPSSPACAQQQANLALLTGNPYSGVFANRYPEYKVGVTFNVPLFGDKTAGAQLGRAKVEAEKLLDQREQIEQAIQVEVRNALQAVRTGEARLRAAAIARENSVRQYESERRKLDEGQSDVYKVLERQTALAIARSNELRARTELNKAIAELQRATGITLAANNIRALPK